MPKQVEFSSLSLIVPAYRQEGTIQEDLSRISKALERIRCNYEMIVIVDGKVDKTFELAKKLESPKINVFGYEKNHGKGYAIRYGIARAHGDLIAFLDAGMDINPNGISMLIEHMIWYNADIVVGSKRHPASKVSYPLKRRLYSMVYQIFVYFLFGLKIRDTQVGLKLFKRKVLEEVLPRLLVKRYAFDIELLAVARYIGYDRIYEAPVDLNLSFSSNIKLPSVVNMVMDTLAVFYRIKILHYYSQKNKRRWVYDPDLDFNVNIG